MKPFRLSLVSALLILGVGQTASAQDPSALAPAPDVMISLDGTQISNSSTNIKQGMQQMIGDHYDSGPCPDPDAEAEGRDPYAECDALRFGLIVHAGAGCDEATNPVTYLVEPAEDSGIDVNAYFTGLPGAGGPSGIYCGLGAQNTILGLTSEPYFRNHDTASLAVFDAYCPVRGATVTEAQLDQYWERPRLNFVVTNGFPADADGGDGTRIIDTVATVCEMYAGNDGLPSIPTWVMMEKNAASDEAIYGGLVSAAGGTGICEYREMGTWSEIDVCAHMAETTRTENNVRTDIQAGKYRCGPGPDSYQVGAIAATATASIRCGLDADAPGTCAANSADLWPTLSCVRQLPRGVAAEDALILVCRDAEADDDDPDGDGLVCAPIDPADIEYIDEGETLFVFKNKRNCEAGGTYITECIPDEACDTGLDGRCGPGKTVCSSGVQTCEPIFDAFPEICNGLDDDCDGDVDNMSTSWEQDAFSSYSLPDDHAGLDCNLIDVCVCPAGKTDTRNGDSFDAYLDSWSGVCTCGENLAPESSAPQPEPKSDFSEPQAACSVGFAETVPASLLMLLGFAGFRRRRRRD